MINATILQIIRLLAQIILGSGALDRIIARVQWWQKRVFPPELSQESVNAVKRNGVLADIDTIDMGLSESKKRLGIELALQVVKKTDQGAA